MNAYFDSYGKGLSSIRWNQVEFRWIQVDLGTASELVRRQEVPRQSTDASAFACSSSSVEVLTKDFVLSPERLPIVSHLTRLRTRLSGR